MDKAILERIEIRQGDITELSLDAIVNAANNSLLGGGGVDGAIHRAAGPELLAACKLIDGCPTGEARMTEGFRLPSRFVIHTVGPVYKGAEQDKTTLESCYRSSLNLAMEFGLERIAFPAISCGVYGYPIEEACQVALETTCAFLKKYPMPDRVIFMLFSDGHQKVYEKYIATL